jgi:glycosyltransferase involved in cell wall biosynthesis
MIRRMKVILFANTDWYLYNFRLELAFALKQAGYKVILMSPDGEYRHKLEEAGFCWSELPLSRRGINPFFELRNLYKIFCIYRNEKPDVVHHFTIKCVLYGSSAARLAGVKNVINSIEGLGYVFIAQGWRVNLMRQLVLHWYRLILKGTKVILLNQDDQAFFIKENLISSQNGVLITGSGVNINRFSPRAGDKISDPVVILAGRMLYDKGVGEYAEAGRILKQMGVHARLVLVGNIDPGNPAAIPLETLESWQEEGIIEWWGWRDNMEMVYQQASIVCLPSYREGLPKMLIEAGACGLPLVVTDIPGCREVVEDGKNGFLVPPRDSQLLADALKKLIVDADLRNDMGLYSRKLVLERFSSDMINEKILAVYDEVLHHD